MMKYLTTLVLFSVLTVIYANGADKSSSALWTCRDSANSLCTSASQDDGKSTISLCTSTTTIHNWVHAETKLRDYAKHTLKQSYELLGLAINHGSFARNRPGFAKLFQQLSDDSFENTIKIIKYMSSRGGSMTFDGMANGLTKYQFYKNEFESLATAQGIEKSLLEFAHGFDHATHDPNTLHFIEEEFIEPKTDVLRKLTGYVHDLDKLLSSKDSSLNLFLFDEYLQK